MVYWGIHDNGSNNLEVITQDSKFKKIDIIKVVDYDCQLEKILPDLKKFSNDYNLKIESIDNLITRLQKTQRLKVKQQLEMDRKLEVKQRLEKEQK